jgi:hypothetical protein
VALPGPARASLEDPPAAEPAADPNELVAVRAEDIPEEGDEILVAPAMLGKLFPSANFDSIQRKEPINIKSVLDQQGITLTNYQQLVELGITNYQIVRAQQPVNAAEAK